MNLMLNKFSVELVEVDQNGRVDSNLEVIYTFVDGRWIHPPHLKRLELVVQEEFKEEEEE